MTSGWINGIFLQTVPGDKISGSSEGTDTLLIRGGIFFLILLIFVFACGYAWRKVPALRALIPEFKPGQSSLEARLQEKKEQQEAQAQGSIEQEQEGQTKISPPNLAKRPGNVRPIALTSVPKADAGTLPLASELYSNDKRIEAALADGTPGAIIHSASDLDGSMHHAPILIVQREDEERAES